ncbi:MAG: UDP-N-acetyl-D-mannosamine dehydrogenase [Ectothiorhodospiraceae bacterium]|nr:UDP-N-acetyl-D-mannosamine dehydrogenase [Paracoccaceae bacterium]MCH8505863.1 UDP-N-acetyl-D-mannosamine dehydrogenase [Ectothiorhodospiraceae bacterium]
MSERRRICVMGLGYIGLPTASLLATKGYEVHGVDVNPDVVETVAAGGIHITEPELDVLVKSAVQSGRLRVGLQPEPADVFILAVPTPFQENHKPDLGCVEASARQIASRLEPGNLVILESTSPPGTTERVAQWLEEERPDLRLPRASRYAVSEVASDVLVAHCPERVLPGHILRELVGNDRIVGGVDEASTEAAAEFYRDFVSGTVHTTNSRTAELAKLTENTFRDVNIALANELSLICNHLDVDVWDLIKLANYHPRVNILQPGPGVGGHCLAVDPWFIVDSAPEQARLIRTARELNDAKPDFVVKWTSARADRLKEPVIACLGLAYKPDIDDLRESPALDITRRLASDHVGRVLAVEPNIRRLPPALETLDVQLVPVEEALHEADIILGLVAHRQFKRIPMSRLQEKILLNVCGLWS